MDSVGFLIKRKYWIAVIVLVLLAVFYLRQDFTNGTFNFLPGTEPSIKSYLSCNSITLLEAPVLDAHKKKTDQIRLLVHFSEKPTADLKDFLKEQNVELDLGSWIYDYAVAVTTVDRLCFLTTVPGITMISLGE